jgi:Na+/melibiose symporter-like transporter
MTAILNAEFDQVVEASPTAPAARLANSLLAMFSGPAIPLAALALPLVVYLPHFYAAHVGVSLTVVGAVFSIVRLLDIGFDPLLGAVMDRTKTRFGRFRPWMAASIPILMIGAYMVFNPPVGAPPAYLVASLVLLYLGYSMAVLGHLAWGSVVAGGYHERSKVYGWVQAATVGGMILVLVLPIIISKLVRNGDAAGVASMGWFVIVLTPVTILLALWRVPEPEAPGRRAEAAGIGQYLKVIRRPAVLRIVGSTILLATAPGITGAVFLFFFRQSRGFSAADTNILLLLYFVGGLFGAPIWSAIARRVGKHRALMISCGYYILMQSLTLTFPKGSLVIGGPVMLLAGIAFSAYLILLRAMAADACDEARLDLHSDCTGMIYALQNAGTKVGSALGVAITFPLLQHVFGFDPILEHNSDAAIGGLNLAFTVLPIAVVVLGGLVLIGYRLNEQRHGEVREALARRDEVLLA